MELQSNFQQQEPLAGMGCVPVALSRASSTCKAHRPPPADFHGSPSPWKPLTHMSIKGSMCRGDYGTQGRQPHKPHSQTRGLLGLPWRCLFLSSISPGLALWSQLAFLWFFKFQTNKQTRKQIHPPPTPPKNKTKQKNPHTKLFPILGLYTLCPNTFLLLKAPFFSKGAISDWFSLFISFMTIVTLRVPLRGLLHTW